MDKKIPNIGRPSKTEATKKSAKIFINMTTEQKEILVKKAEELDLSLSQLCLYALKKGDFFK